MGGYEPRNYMNELSLFPYQSEGAKWLTANSHALLADDMGLGKSAQVINACDQLDLKRILILCPAVARQNWEREFTRFSTQERKFDVVLAGTTPLTPTSSVICSYDLATPLKDKLIAHGPWDVVVIDEAHFLKGLKTQRTQTVFGKEGLVRHAAKVWAVSGTPAPNHAGELWPMLYTFGATPLSYDNFVERYCSYYLGGHGGKTARVITGTKVDRIPELKNILGRVMLRRRKEDVLTELPPIHYTDIVVPPGEVDLEVESSFIQYVFPTDRREELKAKLDFERKLVEGIIEKAYHVQDGMKALEAMANSVSTLRRYTGLQKVQAVADLVKEELESGAYEKVVLFAIHRDVIEGLRVRLSKFKAVTLYGGTDPATRQKNVDKFQNSPKCKVFIGNIAAAGTAITLTAAHHIIFVEQDWVPGNNAQAAMRCHRIGQTRPVSVRFVGLANSIDQRISFVLKRKASQLTKIFDDA